MILFVTILDFLFVIIFSFCDKKVLFSRIPGLNITPSYHIAPFCDYLISKYARRIFKKNRIEKQYIFVNTHNKTH